MIVEVLLLAVGCTLLFYGGDWLVDAISGLAVHIRIPPVVVAFVVMGFGTSAPELFVAINAMLAGAPDIAMGNIVGSNIANLLLVLALVALIAPLKIDQDTLRIEGTAMLVAALALWAAAMDGTVSRIEAALLVMGLVVYLVLRWRLFPAEEDALEDGQASLTSALVWTIIALIALPVGAHIFIENAISIAGRLGVSEALIGLTVVALGTSLPEIASCVAATLRRESGMILGGILGSNVFNGTIVLGFAAFFVPVTVTGSFLSFWIPAMISATFVTLVFLRTGFLLSRREAALMLAGYVAIFVV